MCISLRAVQWRGGCLCAYHALGGLGLWTGGPPLHLLFVRLVFLFFFIARFAVFHLFAGCRSLPFWAGFPCHQHGACANGRERQRKDRRRGGEGEKRTQGTVAPGSQCECSVGL